MRTLLLGWVLATVLAMPALAACTQQAEPTPPVTQTVASDTLRADEPAPVVALASADSLKDDRSVAEKVHDATVAARLKQAFASERQLRRFDFDPLVLRGVVTLRTLVETVEERQLAAEIARRTEGVVKVINVMPAVEDTLLRVRSDSAGAWGAAMDTLLIDPDALREPLAPPPLDEAATALEEADEVYEVIEDAPRDDEIVETGAGAPTSGSAAPSEGGDGAARYHVVEAGESLWGISQQHGLTPDELKRLNGLRSNVIRVGQRLRVR